MHLAPAKTSADGTLRENDSKGIITMTRTTLETDHTLTTTTRDGRTIVTFETDVDPAARLADPDALHSLHVERVRYHLHGWAKLDAHYQDDQEIRVHFADHLPTGRVVTPDGVNHGTAGNRAKRLRRELALLEARQDVLIEHFAGEEWAEQELDALREEVGRVSADLQPYEQADVRRATARRVRRHRARKDGKLAPVGGTTEDQQLRHGALVELGVSTARGTMSEPMGTARNLRQIAQVAA